MRERQGESLLDSGQDKAGGIHLSTELRSLLSVQGNLYGKTQKAASLLCNALKCDVSVTCKVIRSAGPGRGCVKDTTTLIMILHCKLPWGY
ncbi:hypothetical protein FKM82_017831 [Ascaphus truei]